MSRTLVFLLSVGLLAVAGVARATSQPVEIVTKDAKGRVTSRATTTENEGGHRTLSEFVGDTGQLSFVVDEDFDGKGRVTMRVEQRFDAQGRIRERVEIRLDEAGKKTGTRKRYTYDSSGGRAETSTPVR